MKKKNNNNLHFKFIVQYTVLVKENEEKNYWENIYSFKQDKI